MVIHKILNNNLILSRDGQGHEVIVKGCGIAFQKKKGQQVEESRIEKIFTAENAQISKEIQGYLTAIPEKYLDFVEAFVNEVKEKEGMKLNDSIYFSLSDHIMGAISRLENGIRLQNMLLLDIKQLYHKEYEIGLELLKKVNEMFEVDLSADEAGFFALHFVNAEDGGKTDSYQISIIVHQILDIGHLILRHIFPAISGNCRVLCVFPIRKFFFHLYRIFLLGIFYNRFCPQLINGNSKCSHCCQNSAVDNASHDFTFHILSTSV